MNTNENTPSIDLTQQPQTVEPVHVQTAAVEPEIPTPIDPVAPKKRDWAGPPRVELIKGWAAAKMHDVKMKLLTFLQYAAFAILVAFGIAFLMGGNSQPQYATDVAVDVNSTPRVNETWFDGVRYFFGDKIVHTEVTPRFLAEPEVRTNVVVGEALYRYNNGVLVKQPSVNK